MQQNILLDPNIRDWVLLPLIAIVIFLGILRHYATLLFTSQPNINMTAVCNTNIANYARLLIHSGNNLSPVAYKKRVEELMNHDLKKKVSPPNPMEMMNDPNMMMGLLKNQFMTLVPNMGMMMLVSNFFTGFVVAKLPFPLYQRFRGMMQRGLDIDDLDCTYVTSLSMYFLIMFGSQGILQLLLGQDATMNDQTYMMQQVQGGSTPGQPVDYSKVFKQISEELEFMKDRHKWSYANAPDTLLKEWRAVKRQANRKNWNK
ncbi:unnamed protein product [Phytomonas sp. Hart1]|nr:unnamed protein product [Phytomonas sp. Hart1]|eukprot:CCW67103.1 unnamed protein product [Phytomonas sp. isolate Hart1]